MIESLGEHGVDPSDLVPALMATHTVKNPEFDPEAKKRADREAERIATEGDDEVSDTETEAPPPYQPKDPSPLAPPSDSPKVTISPLPTPPTTKTINPFGDDEDEEPIPSSSSRQAKPNSIRLPSFDFDEDDGDIGVSSPAKRTPAKESPPEDDEDIGGALSPVSATRNANSADPFDLTASTLKSPSESPSTDSIKTPRNDSTPLPDEKEEPTGTEVAPALPALPGVSTTLTSADEVVTLDIRWTVVSAARSMQLALIIQLCDLFLVLISDSIYDARSRVYLEKVAEALGFAWLDVVRFENRITDALEIQESLEQTEQGIIIEGRRKGALKKRYAMMGLAAVGTCWGITLAKLSLGGGLVIGLSAGLMAPPIGAGLGAAFATVGITGTTGFLAGVGGAAMITTTGVLTGANIAGRGMGRRTREVRTFELRPLHNNQRVSCYITVGGCVTSSSPLTPASCPANMTMCDYRSPS